MTSQKNSLPTKFMQRLMLRAMQPNDSEALARIYLGSRQHNFPWVKHPRLDDFLTVSRGETVKVAVLDEEIVGFASLLKQEYFLHLLFVKEGWNGHGIGAQLLSWARHEVTKPLELKVVTGNIDAQRFYQREGFVVVDKSVFAKPQNLTYRDNRK
ncbi:N-acetyltransferase [Leuconostoc litchii]|uniref:GNAT family N-acetyltransferase n=1 Tax=Leuconostoc litchii TaxID=1981069 RepID=A0A6P2CKU5_9LACO|nr:GNAT family N-acetyltransferase [Leuconostoc litchii]TYC46039.1 GNAT family N-acetyltransferase [Leuconostoc litchii]GMA69886.1 N-acetyltransferase [Leuconostoc litchii]